MGPEPGGPDNRRPVDFEKRRAMLAGIREQDDADIGRLVQDLLSTREDGKIKLFLIYRALKAKKANREIFRSGAYLPLEPAGRFRNHVIAFAWRYEQQWALVIAPRFLSHLVQEGDFPLGRQVWQDTEVIMPDGAPAEWRNVITSEVLSAGRHCLSEIYYLVFQWRCSWAKARGGRTASQDFTQILADCLGGGDPARRVCCLGQGLGVDAYLPVNGTSMNLWG